VDRISNIVIYILIALLCLAIGVLAGYIARKTVGEKAIGSAEQTAKNMLLDAEKKAETIKKEISIEAKEEAHKLRSDVDKEIKDRRAEMTRMERRLIQKEEAFDKKIENLEKKEDQIHAKEQKLSAKEDELNKFIEKQIEELEKISGMSSSAIPNLVFLPAVITFS